MLQSASDIATLVNQWGFLPFFANEIDGFSIEEHVNPDFWFPEGTIEGVWEWKNDIIDLAGCAYGKFYLGKACYISMQWFPHLINLRRSQHQLSTAEQELVDTVAHNESLLSRELKKMCGYTAPPRSRQSNPIARAAEHEQPRPQAAKRGFDTIMTRLQMSCHLLSAYFEYNYDRQGNRYGWSVARYCTPEAFFGTEAIAVDTNPAKSRQLLIEHLAQLLPQASPRQIERIVDYH